jgi:hypothetical protein
MNVALVPPVFENYSSRGFGLGFGSDPFDPHAVRGTLTSLSPVGSAVILNPSALSCSVLGCSVCHFVAGGPFRQINIIVPPARVGH